MSSRIVSLSSIVICLCLFQVANAQSPGEQTFTSGLTNEHYLPSPLSASFGTNSQLSAADTAIETRKINIGPAVAAYAKIKKVDMQRARFDALEYLGAQLGQPGQIQERNAPVQFKPIGADRYEVTAQSIYFTNLPAKIRSFELGKKSIVVTIKRLKVDDTTQHEIRRFLNQDSISHIAGAVAPVAPKLPEAKQGSPYQAASTLLVSKSTPLTVGQLDLESYEQLVNFVTQKKTSSASASPSIVCHPSQDALLQDGAQRPFVVGVKKIKGDFATAHQPIIQTLENGDYFKINCDIQDHQVNLNCMLGFAEVTKVDAIAMEKFQDGSEVNVQSPSQLVRAINLATTLEQDQVLFVDPYHTTITETKKGKKSSFRKHNVVVLIRTQIIDDEIQTK